MLLELRNKEKLKKSKKRVKWQKRSFHLTKAIASKDRNNLYIASSFFRDRIKYKAFCSYYAVMRIVDDRIDNLPLPAYRREELFDRELNVVNAWEQVVIMCHQGIYPTTSQLEACDFKEVEAVCDSLIAAFQAIPIPIKLWKNFFDAMRSDINAVEFNCWSDFLAYAEGASIAPTTIYLSLITAQRNGTNSSYKLPAGFDLIRCGRYLGIFAYLAHIIRDLAEDIKQASTRLCITREDMAEYSITPERLRIEALKDQVSAETRSLVVEILQRARNYLVKGRALTFQLQDFLSVDGRFILELIITIYEHIIAKIESADYDPMGRRHYISMKEKAHIVHSVALRTGFSLPDWAKV